MSTPRYPSGRNSAADVDADVGLSSYPVVNVCSREGFGVPKRSNEFQRLVAMLTMLKSEGAIVHESVDVMEITSQERREVDVVAFGKVAGHQSAVFIECRDWKRPQDVQWVEQARTKFDDLVVPPVSSSGVRRLVAVRGFRPAWVDAGRVGPGGWRGRWW
jgi:hypothetical protein